MKPRLLFYCQHSVGLGHLARSFALVRALREDFSVTLACGGVLPPGIPVPSGIVLESLPAHTTADGKPDPAISAARRDRLLALQCQQLPAVVLIELFPFGRKKFANELLPLLKQSRRTALPPLIACSLRDILVSGRRGQAHHDDRAAWLCNRYFDRLLIHADPALARLEDSFTPPRQILRTPTHYTGYVAPPRRSSAGAHGRHILVSAGGGLVGLPLFMRVLQAHALLDPARRRPLRLVAGPFLPERDYQDIAIRTRLFGDVELLRSVPDLAAEMSLAAGSISQCGYNTAMDILATGTPALVLPYATATETEQLQRACRLRELGMLDWLDATQSSDAELAAAIERLGTTKQPALRLNLDGARRTAALLRQFLSERMSENHEHVA